MKPRPILPTKECACCLMPNIAGVAVRRYTVQQGTRAVPAPSVSNLYCDLCAKHIASLGVVLESEEPF